MNIIALSNKHLVENFENCVRTERKITSQIIEYVSEIDRRQLYFEKGHSSLFDYLTKSMGYSPGAAMRRIDAARLLCDIPQVTEKIKQGAITISQTTQLQRALRDYKKIKKESLSKSEKHALFTKIENTNQKETEKIIATTLGLPITTIQKQQLHRDSSVTLTLTFTAEQFELLEKAQNMISHAVPNRQWADTLTYLAQKEVTRRSIHKSSKNSTPVASVEKTTKNTKIESRKTRYIPASIRKTMLDANETCMFKNKDGGTCKNKRFLQIDHIQSWSSGGSNTLDNLQVLCSTHNRFKYSKSQN